MQISQKWRAGAVTGAAMAALVFGSVPAAVADPASGTNPVIDGFGSDTTQDVMGAIATVLKDGKGEPIIASYNANPAHTLVKSGEDNVRDVPTANGSGEGRKALLAAIDGTSVTFGTQTSSAPLQRQDVEFARSSGGGKWIPAGKLTYIPFGVDAVTYAVKGTSVVPKNLPLGAATDPDDKLTLRNIYRGTVTQIKKNGRSYPLTPMLPQAGSGTRSFWLSALGLKETDLGTSIVATDEAGKPVQENDGVHVTRDTDIVPFSVGQYASGAKARVLNANYPGTHNVDKRHSAVLGYINGVDPLNVTKSQPNINFPVKRAVYNVVETAAITPGTANYNQQLVDLFVGATSRVQTAKSAAGTLTINDYGFASIPDAGIRIGADVFKPGATNLQADS